MRSKTVGCAKHPSNHCRPRESKQRRRVGQSTARKPARLQPTSEAGGDWKPGGRLTGGVVGILWSGGGGHPGSRLASAAGVGAQLDAVLIGRRIPTMVIARGSGPAGSGSRRDNNARWRLAGSASRQKTKKWRNAGCPHSLSTLLFPIHLDHFVGSENVRDVCAGVCELEETHGVGRQRLL